MGAAKYPCPGSGCGIGVGGMRRHSVLCPECGRRIAVNITNGRLRVHAYKLQRDQPKQQKES